MEQKKRLLYSYLHVTQHVSQQVCNYFSQLELSFPQGMVLIVLSEEGTIPISRLAQYIGVANSTMSGMVDRLEKLKLVKRERSQEDRRVIYVTLSPEYRALREKRKLDADEYLSKLFGGLSQQDLSDICAALEKLAAVLARAEE